VQAHRQEFVIGGWTDPKGSRAGIGSLLLGVHGDDGKLRYAGNVGTGFNDRTLRDLRSGWTRSARHAARSTAAAPACRARAHWVQPELVCEVSYGEMTREGKVRHSVFHGLRDDKPAEAVSREEAVHVPPRPRRAWPRGRRSVAQGCASPGGAAPAALPPACA
jgi:bifunctional non-homologous end joining protein LigD